MANKSLIYAYVLATILNMAFFMPVLVLPYLTKRQGISDTTYGYFITMLMAFQVIGGPIYGNIIRLYGMKTSLNLCYLSTFLWAIILWTSQGFYGLLISRFVGIFMNGQQVNQALITKLTEPGKERTNAFGKLGFTFGLNFLLSPLFVKIITSTLGERSILLFSAFMSILAMIINYLFINEKELKTNETPESKKTENKSSWDSTYLVLQRPNVFNAFAKKLLLIAPLMIIFMNLQIYMIRRFEITAGGYGAVQAFMGVFMMIVNGLGISWLRTRYSEPKLLLLGNICVVLTTIQFVHFEYVWQLAFIIPPLALGMSLVGAVADSVITSSVKPEEQGIILGFVSGVEVFFRTIAPALGGYVLDNYSFGILGFIGLIASSIALGGAFLAPIEEIEKHGEKSYENGTVKDKKIN